VTTDAIDLTDPGLFVRGEHHAALRQLRETAAVWWNAADTGGFWAVTRYDDAVRVYRDHVTFSSASGVMLGGSVHNEKDTASGRMLVAADPPRHRLLRAAMHPAFAGDMAKRVAASVDELTDIAVNRALRDGGCDFATDIAEELPVGALMAMVRIGDQDARHLVRLTRRMIEFRSPTGEEVDERIRLVGIHGEIFEFFADLVAERRKRPGDDLVSLLLATTLNGRKLSEPDILYNCLNVAVGGNETSLYTACGGLVALANNPAQFDALAKDPDLLDSALAEMLRWTSVNAYVLRVAVRDTEIDGTPIRAGDRVTVWNVSANRDESQFADPDRFDVARHPNQHLAFGHGVHRCIGSTSGTAELSVLFGKLARRRIRVTLAGPVRRLHSNFILGITGLPVELRPTTPADR
jgi:cytochrome P450